jgi:hypothetical protein
MRTRKATATLAPSRAGPSATALEASCSSWSYPALGCPTSYTSASTPARPRRRCFPGVALEPHPRVRAGAGRESAAVRQRIPVPGPASVLRAAAVLRCLKHVVRQHGRGTVFTGRRDHRSRRRDVSRFLPGARAGAAGVARPALTRASMTPNAAVTRDARHGCTASGLNDVPSPNDTNGALVGY